MNNRIVLTIIVAISILIMIVSMAFFPDVSAFIGLSILVFCMYYYSKNHGASATLGIFFKELFLAGSN